MDYIEYDNKQVTKKYGRIKSITYINIHPKPEKKVIRVREGKKIRTYTTLVYPKQLQYTAIKT